LRRTAHNSGDASLALALSRNSITQTSCSSCAQLCAQRSGTRSGISWRKAGGGSSERQHLIIVLLWYCHLLMSHETRRVENHENQATGGMASTGGSVTRLARSWRRAAS